MDAVRSARAGDDAARSRGQGVWGSDAVADALRALALPYVCLVPGSSFRGLHDSVVNYLGNRTPQMLLCLHEEHAVAIAHGWAKVTGQPLAVIVHANVGLMHATMAIFDAWCDRMPVIVLGATGPLDETKRRPWVDWIHTARDQGALVRHYVKWDDQPSSIAAAQESVMRAAQIATTPPHGPVYVCLDAGLQETKLDAAPRTPDVERFRAPAPAQPAPEQLTRAAEWLVQAKRPLILMGRVSRSEDDWRDRVALAEHLGATVLTDARVGAAFPTDHPLHGPASGLFPSAEAAAVLRSADVVLSLDWLDLGGTLRQAWGAEDVDARIIQASMDQDGAQRVEHGPPEPRSRRSLFPVPAGRGGDAAAGRRPGARGARASLSRGADSRRRPWTRVPVPSRTPGWPTHCARPPRGSPCRCCASPPGGRSARGSFGTRSTTSGTTEAGASAPAPGSPSAPRSRFGTRGGCPWPSSETATI